MNVKETIEKRVNWIKNVLAESGAKGIIYGNSGGKDCTLVGALCKMATDNVLGVIMPCQSSRNYGSDREDALLAGEKFGIEQTEVDLTAIKSAYIDAIAPEFKKGNAGEKAVSDAYMNINPRIRMTVLYALAQSKGYLVAGTGNLCEAVMGYFTKWGDGAYDFNPIADLTVPEEYEILKSLDAPCHIIDKAPSAGLFEGQTDEGELGISYATVAVYLKGEKVSEEEKTLIERAKLRTEHKRRMPLTYQD